MSPTMTVEHGASARWACLDTGPSGQPVQGSAGASGRRQGRLDHPQRVIPERIDALEGRAYLAGEDTCLVLEK